MKKTTFILAGKAVLLYLTVLTGTVMVGSIDSLVREGIWLWFLIAFIMLCWSCHVHISYRELRKITLADRLEGKGKSMKRKEAVRILKETGIWSDRDEKFHYWMLSRLQSDCNYFLGHGNREPKMLWTGDVDRQILVMRALYAVLPKKPVWLTEDGIDNYETEMKKEIKGGTENEKQGL